MILMYDEIIYFSNYETGSEKDAYGDPDYKEIRTPAIFAERKSISQTEFYQAQTAGTKPELKFVIPDYLEYSDQQYLIHAGVRYKVLRTYHTDGNELEITCYGGVRDVSAAVSDKNQ